MSKEIQYCFLHIKRHHNPFRAVMSGSRPYFVMWCCIALFLSQFASPAMSVDSAVYTMVDLDQIIPHFPPLYMLFARLAENVCVVGRWISTLHHGSRLSIDSAPPFTPAVAHLMLAAQHLFAVAAAWRLAARMSDRTAYRMISVAVLYLNPVTLGLTNAIVSESLAAPALYCALAEAVPVLVWRRRERRYIALFALWMGIAALIRHPLVVLAAVLPIGLFLDGIRALVLRARLQTTIRALGVSLAAIAVVIVGVSVVELAVENALGVEPFSVPGRAFTYRLAFADLNNGMLPGLDQASLRDVIEKMKRSTDDPQLRQTIDLVAAIEPWHETWIKVISQVAAPHCTGCRAQRINGNADRLLNRVMMLALLGDYPSLWKDALLRTGIFLHPGNAYWTGQSMQLTASGTFDPAAIEGSFLWPGRDFEALLRPSAMFLGRNLFLAACVVAAVLVVLRRRWALFSCSALLAAALYALATSVVTVYVPRYALPIEQISLVVLLAALIEMKWPQPWRAAASKARDAGSSTR